MGTADVKLYLQGVGVKRFGDLTTKKVAGATLVRVRVEFRRALALRSEIRRAGWFN